MKFKSIKPHLHRISFMLPMLLAFATQATESVSHAVIAEGKKIFRHDTFGDESFWGGQLRLHDAIKGAKNGGVGPGLSPKAALQAGLKVDVDMLPKEIVNAIKAGTINLDDPNTTLALLKLNSVVGVKGIFNGKNLKSVGITCALCHSSVDNSLTSGIGHRLDGWPNRDLNIGAVVAMAPNLKPFQDALGVNEATVKAVLLSWGPGKYDAELNMDGKAFRPDGKSGATVLPAAFGLRGVNLHTYTGWGSVPHWNAYVAVTQMHGHGTFVDHRLHNPAKFPLAVKNGSYNVRSSHDLVSSKLPALHAYQLSLSAPKPDIKDLDKDMIARGKVLFEGKAKCASCHVPPLFTEPGYNMHTAQEIGIDNFQASRSPDGKYRTTPLSGLFVREKGGFYHDGRFATYRDVINHYDNFKQLDLSVTEKEELEEYLRSI